MKVLRTPELTLKVHFYSADQKQLLGLLETEAKAKNCTPQEMIRQMLYDRYHEQRLKVVEKDRLTEGC